MAQLILTGFADEAAVNLTEQIKALQASQMHFVELRQVNGVNIGSMTQEQAKEAACQLRDAGIGVSCLGTPLGKTPLNESFEPVAEMTRRLCDHAHTFGSDNLRIFSFYLPEGQSAADCRAEVIDRMGRMLDIAASEAISLLHENERDIYGDIQARCYDLHQAFGQRLRGILDPANYLLVGTDPLAAMKQLEPWIDYLHIKDVRLSDRRIVPAGAGDGQISEILSIMKHKPGKHFVSIEPHLTLFAGRDKLEKETGVELPQSAEDYVYQDGPTAFAAAVAACRRLLGQVS
ncbi:MAG: sugar phosphate isomerase/epimerase [Ruminococcaceae bacterium]|jgi:sugar phosphate isomerase/epimerase|nr:sugar phosphate isomerase/epimerase [Oscillospiraceae bacterium]